MRMFKIQKQRFLTALIFLGLILYTMHILVSQSNKTLAGQNILELEKDTALIAEIQHWNITRIGIELYLITMLSLNWGNTWPGYDLFNITQLNERNQEYLDVLQSNINHPLVKEVHLFYLDENSLQVVKSQPWINMPKIVPCKTPRRMHMMDFFRYASIHLINKTVVGLNGDIAIGEGFDLINENAMRNNKIMYTLTRHGSPNCNMTNMCLHMEYQGSHDTHIFNLKEPLSPKILHSLDYPINMKQAENGMIGVFLNKLNFKVYNPCKTLKTYHHHCSRVRKKGKNYSIKKKPFSFPEDQLGKAPPISDLPTK